MSRSNPSPDDHRKPKGDATLAVHGPTGEPPREGPLTEPIALTTTFAAERTADLDDLYEGRREGYIYSRQGNPTVDAVAAKVAALEGTERAILTGSGISAIGLAVLTFARSGGRLLAVDDLYGGTNTFFRDVLPRFGVTVERFPTTEAKALEALLEAGPADVVYLESPTNPTLRLPDVAACARLAREHGAVSLIDSTFASPVNSKPRALGVDVVVHSATKYLGGHADLTAGAVCADAPHAKRLLALHKVLGATLDPHAAYLLDRGLKTLPLRVRASNANALALATFLASRPEVVRVHYPGLPTHPQHDLARRQMPGGFGGVVSFDLPTKEAAYAFSDAVRVVANAASLGGVESLVSLPVVQSHRHMSEEQRARHGITPGTVRLSVGVEDVEDLKADVAQALEAGARA